MDGQQRHRKRELIVDDQINGTYGYYLIAVCGIYKIGFEALPLAIDKVWMHGLERDIGTCAARPGAKFTGSWYKLNADELYALQHMLDARDRYLFGLGNEDCWPDRKVIQPLTEREQIEWYRENPSTRHLGV